VHEKASTADIVDAKAQLPVQLSVGAAAQSTDKPALRASAEASVSATEFIELSRIDFTSSLIKAASGSWTRSERETIMTDAKSLHAKLVMTTPQTDGPTVYEFTARSLGSGWVGFGLHLHGQGKWSLSRYGGGDSILVWITSDPKNYGDTGPRLQVYRSIDEVAMDRVASIRIEGSCFESRKYRIEYDPVQGFMKVWVDGKLHMELDGLKGSSKSDFAALRALDRAEFSDFGMAKTNSILHRSEPSNE
jgi:hypothetical protein